MTDLRAAAQQALEALEKIADWHGAYGPFPENNEAWRGMAVVTARASVNALKAALEQPEQAPAAWINPKNLQGLTLGLYGYAEIYTDESQGRIPLYTHPPRREPEQEPIPFSGADEKPPVFGRRWRIAKDGFGLQLDNDGPYVEINDALSVLHAALEQQAKPDVEYYGLEPWEVPQHIPFATAIYPAHSPDKPFLALGDCAHLYRDAAKCVPLYTHPPRREWRSLSEEEILPLYSMLPSSHAEMLEFARAVEQALKEKNYE